MLFANEALHIKGCRLIFLFSSKKRDAALNIYGQCKAMFIVDMMRTRVCMWLLCSFDAIMTVCIMLDVVYKQIIKNTVEFNRR